MSSVHAIVGGDLANAMRILVIFGGGWVVGAGCIVLVERAAFYRRAHLDQAPRAMYTLCIVNALVLTFIVAMLLERWSEEITWRWLLAILIFSAEGMFFRDLRNVGLEQERQLLFSDRRP